MIIDFESIIKNKLIVNCETREEEHTLLTLANESKLFKNEFATDINFWKKYREQTCQDLFSTSYSGILTFSSVKRIKVVKFKDLIISKIVVI